MSAVPDGRVDAVRRFNRFYTQRTGMLRQRLYASRWSLAEVRVLYEIARAGDAVTAAALARNLGLDPGYLSRILRRFETGGHVRRTPSAGDARRFDLALTAAGRRAFASIDRASHDEVAALLAPLADDAQARLVDALRTAGTILGERAGGTSAFMLRPLRPGDIGWVISRHGALYSREYGWDATFEALVAEIAARFVRRYDPRRECCWIAERDGINVGSGFVVGKTRAVAQLRLLLVEPSARGAGIGRSLVGECIAFARRSGYRRMTLWTNRGLDAARHLYEDAGFRLTAEEPHHSFGKDLVGQTFDLDL
jgi:DNA-binding MarR family transcriptional regulator/GNAT superfamily N-acetyltransferase